MVFGMLNIVLVRPQIPANTGNIGRTCVLTGSRLHLVGPMGFSLDETAVRRAGLAYWESLDLVVHESWDEFARSCLPADFAGVHLLTKTGATTYTQASYANGDWLVFGNEGTGLDRELLLAQPGRCERIPMVGDDALANADSWHRSHRSLHPEARQDICGNFVDEREGRITSLNLSNAVAIVTYEALRQIGYPHLV